MNITHIIQVMQNNAKRILGLNVPIRSYYFDTNALRRLPLKEGVAVLLDAARNQSINLYLCDLVIWEFARKHHQDVTEKKTNPTSSIFTEEQKSLHLRQTLGQMQKLFADNGVRIMSSDAVPPQILQDHLSQQDTYFKQKNINDCRDARILLTAKLNTHMSGVTVVCEDNNLREEFIKSGFCVSDNARAIIEKLKVKGKNYKLDLPEISSVNCQISDSLRDILLSVDPKYGKLIQLSQNHDLLIKTLNELSRDDRETRVLILALVQAAAPITEAQLIALLSPPISEVDIKRNIGVLQDNSIIRMVRAAILPNKSDKEKKEMCEQAMALKIDVVIDMLSRG